MVIPVASVIMNCYNGEKYLHEAIESVLSQTYHNWEIIFWDNKSTDTSAEIFKSYNDDRLKYFYAENHTLLYEARNYAIEQASGEFFAFLDVDDTWVPEKLEKQIPLFKEKDVGLVYANYWFNNVTKNSCKILYKNKLPTGTIINDLLDNYVVGLLTIIVRRKCFFSMDKQFDISYNIIGDFDLTIRIAAKYKIECIQDPLAIYRYHEESISFQQRDKQIDEMEKWVSNIYRYPEIAKQTMFVKQKEHILYSKIVNLVYDNKKIQALKLFAKVPFGRLKLKSFLMLLLPMKLIVMIRH
jgi:glycosyltransferase involved in cell wall biosynthesis